MTVKYGRAPVESCGRMNRLRPGFGVSGIPAIVTLCD